ncbi:MAG TPA: hypothetical protein DCM86_14805 [Verrucomicrobiales bacterium]|nr:hypothetical protein [Verrucomicrobiales bacterium]
MMRFPIFHRGRSAPDIAIRAGRRLAFGAGLAWLLCSLALPAADWPQWRGPNRDGLLGIGSSLPATLPSDPPPAWRLSVGDGLASPVVSGGRLYHLDAAGGKEIVHALDSRDGRELWSSPVDESFADEQGPPGPRCTPVVDGDRLYVQSCRGELQCRATEGGRLLWRANFLKEYGAVLLGEDSKVPGAAEHGYTASPLVLGDLLIACPGGTNGAGVVAFNKRTGVVAWKSQDDLASYAAPIAARLAGVEQIVCFTVEGVIGLRPRDGGLLWRYPLTTSYGRNVTTPLVAGGDRVVVGSYKAGLVGLRIVADGGGLRVERSWVNRQAAMNFSSPVLLGEFLYGLGPAKNLICLEAATGRLIWSKEGLFPTSADAAFGAFIGSGSRLLVWTDVGEAILGAVDAAGFRELGRAQVCGKNWCHPAWAGGRLFVRDGMRSGGNLVAIDLALPTP